MADRATWQYVDELGYDMLFGSGATVNLQPRPETITGYENVAKYATVTGNANFGKPEYLSDGMFTAQRFSQMYEYGKTDGGLELTLKWDQPVSACAVMIYNSGNYYDAFNKVNMITFKLAEKPAWYLDDRYNGYCYIKNLSVDTSDALNENFTLRKGNSAIAEFNTLKITEMSIYISGAPEDKFTTESESAVIEGGNKAVKISEIYIFGNKA